VQLRQLVRESDDRFYLDGETEPSIVGTGCEDFFNDAWNLRLFSNANTGVTIKEANGEDCRFTAYRWHTQAPVIFRQSLKVDIERRSFAEVTNPKTGQRELHDFKYRPDFCSSVAFWYQKTVAEPFDRFPSYAERVNPEIFLETSDLASEIKTAPGVTAASHSNRVCNLKRALYVDNSASAGGLRSLAVSIGKASIRSRSSSASTEPAGSGRSLWRGLPVRFFWIEPWISTIPIWPGRKTGPRTFSMARGWRRRSGYTN